MKIIGIVAADRNWAIGKKNGLLYKLPLDMKHFKETTLNHFVVAGVNTVNSFPGGKALKDRVTICIDQEGKSRTDALVVKSTEECLKLMQDIAATPYTEFYIIGGGYCYQSFLPYYDEVIVTKVEAEDPEATVFFPNLDKNSSFKIINESETVTDGKYKTRYVTYERIK